MKLFNRLYWQVAAFAIAIGLPAEWFIKTISGGSDQVTTGFVNEYRMGVQILAQQEGSRLRDKCRREDQNSEVEFFDQIAATEAEEITDRHGDTSYTNTPHARRSVKLRFFQWADLIDKKDRVRMVNDPQGPYVQNAGYAMGRKMDRVWIDAVFGTALTGKTGTTSTTFPAGNVVAVNLGGSTVGLTVRKLREARRLIRSKNVPKGEKLYMGVTAKQIDDLLGETQVGSSDYNAIKALVDGEVTYFMGWEFVHSEMYDVDSNSYRRVPAWAYNGMLMTANPEMEAHIDVMPGKRHSTQVAVYGNFGATRMDEDRVLEIKCSEA